MQYYKYDNLHCGVHGLYFSMAVLDITIILLLVHSCSIGNARVIETSTLAAEGTTIPVLPLNESTTLGTATEESSNKTTKLSSDRISYSEWLTNRTTTLTAEETAAKLLLCPGTTQSMLLSNSTTILTTTISELLLSNETSTLEIEGTETPVMPSTETTPLTTNTSTNLTTFTTESSATTTSTPVEANILDLAFIMDTTGSMGSYIDSARQNIRFLVDEIAGRDNTDLRVALIEYRDHPPQDSTFVTRTHDFTSSIRTIKRWLKKANANGGGDGPEAVAEGLFDAATKLSWRPDAAKISVLISDAPPHGLVPWEDRSFPEGSPNGHDPIEIVHELTKREITLYTVGCEPSINKYKDFFMMIAYLTGGQYIPLTAPRHLIEAIIGGTQEEMSLQKFSKYVEEEIKRVTEICGTIDEASVAMYVYDKLQNEGATSKQLLRNNKPLEGASDFAQSLASSVSMADVRAAYVADVDVPRHDSMVDGLYHSESSHAFRMEIRPEDDVGELEFYHPMTDMFAEEIMPEAYYDSDHSVEGADSDRYDSSSTDTGESYSTVESAISLDQIARLVRKKTAKLSGA